MTMKGPVTQETPTKKRRKSKQLDGHKIVENNELTYKVANSIMVEAEDSTKSSLVDERINTPSRETKLAKKTCSYCNREISLGNISRHLKTQHPEFF